MRPIVLAHRGASAEAPENTMPAFERALAHGADGIELDVTLSADGVPVVIHDDDLLRTAGVPGKVWRLAVAELRQYDVGRWFSPEFAGTRIPTLAEVLDLMRGRGIVNVEIKSRLWRTLRGERNPPPLKRLVKGVLATLAVHANPEAVVVSSFDPRVLRMLRRIDDRWRTGFLRSDTQRGPDWLLWKWSGADFFHPSLPLVDNAARWTGDHGRLLVWTVDSPAEQERLAASGVKAIITNRPAETLAHFRRIGPPSGSGRMSA